MNKIDQGTAGERFVEAKLLLTGKYESVVNLNVGRYNNKDYDIMAYTKGSDFPTWIQVKTYQNSSNIEKGIFTPLTSFENFDIKKNSYFVFAILTDDKLDIKEYYIVPTKIVADCCEEYNKYWLSVPGKNGQPHNESGLRTFYPEFSGYNINEFKNNWNVLNGKTIFTKTHSI